MIFEVSLADLTLFPNLKALYVCDMQTTELETLQNCPQLTSLELIGCGLTDCYDPEPLVQPKKLSLARNKIVSFEPLAKMTDLVDLNLFATSVTDLSPLSGMTELQELLLSYTRITSLEALSSCTALENLESLTTICFWCSTVCDTESVSHVENTEMPM